MTTRVSTVPKLIIPDLARPCLTDVQLAAIEKAEAAPVQLTEESILEAARNATGLQDFGSPDFLERLGIWLQSGLEDRGLNAFGRQVLHSYCVRYASNRLRIEDLYKRHPEIEEVQITRPIFIAGLPRSGTTSLVNLLASDQRLRSLPHWEAVQPVPDGQRAGIETAVDLRMEKCSQEWQQLDSLLPHLRVMHEMSPQHIHEDLELQAIDFTTYNIEWTARVPRWREYYLSHDRLPHYQYLKRVLKALQWQRGPNRWILKCPQHIENLSALATVFPDLTIAITHRDPAAVLRSAVTAIAYGDRVRRNSIDLDETASYWTERIERMLRACVAERDALPVAASIDILFQEYVQDELNAARHVYDLAELPWTVDVETGFRTFLRNEEDRKGSVAYNLDMVPSLRAEAIHERFRFYYDRFAVRYEKA